MFACIQNDTYPISCGGGPVGKGLGMLVCRPLFFPANCLVCCDVCEYDPTCKEMKAVDGLCATTAKSSSAVVIMVNDCILYGRGKMGAMDRWYDGGG